MPTHLYFAPAAEGKTAYAVQLARNTAASLTTDVRVCVPTSLQALAFRERLAGAGGAIGVHVVTFDELVSTCLDLAGEAYTGLSEPVQYRLLRAIIDRLPLTHFEPLKNKPGFIQLLMQMITELKFARIEPFNFLEAAGKLGGEPRLVELALIYERYQDQLKSQEWADRVGKYWLAAETMAKAETTFGRNWSLFIVDGFDDFTPIQLTLLRLISGRAEETVITVTYSQTADYPRFTQTREEVERALGVTGQPLPDFEGKNDRRPELVALGNRLFSRNREIIPTEQAAVALVEAADRTAEVRAALRWLKARLIEDHYRPNEVALLARNTEPYRPFIRQIAEEFELPVRFVDGLPLGQSPLIAALLNLLRLHLPAADNEPEMARRAVVSAWRSPYFLLDFIEPGDADALDNIARHQRVIRGLGQWQAAFEAQVNSAAKEEVVARESDEEEPAPHLPAGAAAQTLQEKFNKFLSLIRPPDGASTMREFVAWLEELIGPDPIDRGAVLPGHRTLLMTNQARKNKTTEAADIAALQVLKDILRGFVWAEEALGRGRAADYIYFFSELSGAVNAALYILPANPDQAEILVADVFRVRGLPFKGAVIMGLSEGEFPAVIGEDPFLRDADRESLRKRFGFELKDSTRTGEREFFYEAISRPAEKLLLTRPTLADNGAAWPPSPFWEAVYNAVGAPALPAPVSGESFIPIETAASWPEYWQSLAETVFPEEQLFETAAWQRIKQAARILRDRERAAENEYEGSLAGLTTLLKDEFGPDHLWSASRLESYQRCGFFFFVQSVLFLQARPEPVEGLDATQLGSIYHRLFEAVYKAGLPDDLDSETIRAFVARVAKPILDAAPHKEGFRETPWWSQTRREIIDSVAASVQKLEEGDFRFFASEMAFGFGGRPNLEIETAAGRLQLRGFIDRIDRDGQGRLRIVDYKLGGPGQFSDRAFQEGKKLQLPLYALAAQETLGLGQVTEGFYWHFRLGKASSFTLSKAEGGTEQAIETAAAYAGLAVEEIRNGRFTPKAPEGGCPSYCPAAAFCWHYSPSGW